MKKLFATALCLFAFCVTTSAQSKATSLNFSYSPVGGIHEKIKLDDEKYNYDYKSVWAGTFSIEKQFKGASTMSEFTYLQGTFDSYDLNGTSSRFDPAQTEDIKSFSFTQYIGTTFNSEQRFQFPLYLGFGGSYLLGGPFHNISFDVAAKARLKFFITDNIALIGGITGRYGWGAKRANEKSTTSTSSSSYTITNTQWYVDAGLSISL